MLRGKIKYQTFGVRFPSQTAEKIIKECQKQNITFSEFLRRCAEKELEKNDNAEIE